MPRRASVGEREIESLFGRGRKFGEGPLPTFLRYVLECGSSGGCVAVILAGQAGFPRKAIERLTTSGRLEAAAARRLPARTG